jgi:hypothetical protein
MGNFPDHRLEWMAEQGPIMFAGAADRGYELIERSLDRHGTFDWTVHQFSDGLHRYVVLGISLLDEFGPNPPCNVDLSIGADDGLLRHTRQLVMHRLFAAMTDMQEQVGWFRESVDTAIDMAAEIQATDLTVTRPLPWSPRLE